MNMYKFIVLLVAGIAVYYIGSDYPFIVYLIGVFVGSTLNEK